MRRSYPNLTYLEEIALSAGRMALRYFREDLTFRLKEDGSKVCAADDSVNKYVIDRFFTDYPHISVIGEEGGNLVPDAEYSVLFDPIDGTAAFLKGQSGFAFCISVLRNQRPILSVIHDPVLGVFWFAAEGCPTLVRSSSGLKAVRVSDKKDISGADINLYWWNSAHYHLDRVAARLQKHGAECHRPVSSAMCGGFVASGLTDASIFPSRNPWETSAISLIVEGAGGRATDLFGNPLLFEVGKMNGHIVSNGHLHDHLLKMVSTCQ